MKYATDPVFGFQVPATCEGVPDHVLDPGGSWPDKKVYMQRYRELASRFIENFKKYEAASPVEVVQAGPKR